MKKILITGGCGIVGSHLVDRLEHDHDIIVFDKNRKPDWWDRPSTWKLYDLTKYNQVEDALEDVDGVIHLGAISRVSVAKQYPRTCMDVNVMGTINILEAIRRQKHPCWFILGSTIEPSTNIYGLSKNIAEKCTKRYVYDYGLYGLVLRFSSIYGSQREILVEGDERVIPYWIKKAKKNEDMIVHSRHSRFDFIHIDDVVGGVVRSIRYIENKSKGFFNEITLCSNELTNLLSLATAIKTDTDSKSKIVVSGEYHEKYNRPSPQKAKMLLDFEAKISIVDGIRRMINEL